MRKIPYQAIVDAVTSLCVEAATKLPDDAIAALKKAFRKEKSERGKAIIRQCLDNARLAAAGSDPVCQDTGAAVFFVDVGSGVAVSGGTIADALAEGVRRGYKEGYLRKSMVSDPLFDRKNTGDNTPPMVHYEPVNGDRLSMTLLPKGGGSENVSGLAMLKPADGEAGVVDFVADTVIRSGGRACPPVIVGVGIGGTSDVAVLLAKRALLRRIGNASPDRRYAALERKILDAINGSGVGPQGLGGTVTALAVHVECAPCHIASLPVAVNVNCWAARKATIVL